MILINKIRAAAGHFLFLAAVFISACIVCSCSICSKSAKVVKYLYPGDVQMWKHIFSQSPAYAIPQTMPESIIIPHHDITAAQQNSFYKALSKVGKPSVIVLVAPDHFEAGKKQIVIPQTTFFDSPEGYLDLANLHDIFDDQRIKDYVQTTQKPWDIEHGIFIHTPFIKHYFPEADFFPVLVKSFSKDDEFPVYEKLAEVLAEQLPKDALVIASVDFSHYQVPRMTELHDYVSMNTIQNGEDLKHIEVDSPESLTVAINFARLRDGTEPVLIDRTCTYDYIPDENIVSTSHQYWTFYKKEALPLIKKYEEEVLETDQRFSKADYTKANQTILIGGSGTVKAGVRYMWDWDRYKKSSDYAEIKLHDLAGTEARFLEGFDAIVFDVQPGETYTSNKHGTELNIKGISAEELQVESLSYKKEKLAENKIDILVVEINESFQQLYEKNKDDIQKIQEQYNVIIFRDSKGLYEAFALVQTPEGKILNIPLGILAGKAPVSGTILCLNWYNGNLNYECFEYNSESAFPPAILQGEI